MSEVIALKMVSGEEIVAELVSRPLMESSGSVNTYILRRPHILRVQQIAVGQLGLAFVPWTLANSDIEQVTVPASAIVLTYAPSEAVEKNYLQQTSGISLIN